MDYSKKLEQYIIPQSAIATEGVGLALLGGFTGLITLGAILTKIENHKKSKTLSDYRALTKNMVTDAVEVQTTTNGQKIITMINSKLPPLINEFNSTMSKFLQELKTSTDKKNKTDIGIKYRKRFSDIDNKAKVLLKSVEDLSKSETEKIDISNNRNFIEKYVDIESTMEYSVDGDSFEEIFDGIEIDQSYIGAAYNAYRNIYRVYDSGARHILLRLK